MNATDDRAKSVFLNAVEIASLEEREAFIRANCGDDEALQREVYELLRHEQSLGSFLDSPAVDIAATTDQRPISERPGMVIGQYKLLQQIGEGGMGVVFMAEQSEPIQRTVALKIIKPGMDTRQVIARFEAERQALAMMDHPNIAKVLDAGMTATGRPYFVMELVKGVPITKHCDEKRLSLRDRLELFMPVCQAVQHAHQKGIIHRDIKPTNVLVAEYDNHAVPKIIDFGVAKATAQKLTERTMFTEFGQVIGTVEYMSPEQAKFNQLDIDTRSDIYSLGVLLYELLTGETPFDRQRLRSAALDEVLQIIREEEPPRPSTRLTTLGQQAASTIAAQRQTDYQRLSSSLRGDLDWIVMKCLEKDRGQRYGSANDLAADLQRYLNDEPVLASPPSWITGFTKWVHRHRAASIAAGLLTLVIALSATISAILLAREQSATAQALNESEQKERALQVSNQELEKERRRAEENLKSARAAVDRMLTRVAGNLSDKPHLTEMQRALLEDALEFYQQFLKQDEDKPELRFETARAYSRVGDIQRALGRKDAAEQSFKEATRLLEALVKQFPADQSYRKDLIEVYADHAYALIWSGRPQENIQLRARQLAAAKAIATQNPSDPSCLELVADAENCLGGAYHLSGLLSQAESHLRESVRILEKLYQDYPQVPKNRWLVAHCQTWLGHSLAEKHRFDEAEPLLLSALAVRKELFVEAPTKTSERLDLAQVTQKVGMMRYGQEKYKESLQVEREAVEMYEKLVDDFPDIHEHRRQLAIAHVQLAKVLWALGSFDDSQDALRRAVFQFEVLAKASPETMEYQNGAGLSHFRLGTGLDALGHEAEAVAEYRLAQDYFERSVGNYPQVAIANLHIASFLTTCPASQFQDPRRATKYARRALQLTPESAELWRILARARYRLDDWAAADDAFAKSFKLQPKWVDTEDHFYRAIIAWRLKKPDEARRWYQTGIEKWPGRPNPQPWIVRIRDEAAALIGDAKPTNPQTK
jgi:serine/threonine protein kinase/predicted Zn-dependent protease